MPLLYSGKYRLLYKSADNEFAQPTHERITVHDSFPGPFTARTML